MIPSLSPIPARYYANEVMGPMRPGNSEASNQTLEVGRALGYVRTKSQQCKSAHKHGQAFKVCFKV